MRFLLLITSLSLGVKTFAFDLQPYTATYQFNLNQQITGTATRTLSKQENNHYSLYLGRQSIDQYTATMPLHVIVYSHLIRRKNALKCTYVTICTRVSLCVF